MKHLLITITLLSAMNSFTQNDTIKEKIPFDGMDMTWQNGSDRRTSPPVLANKYFVGSIMIDANYTHSFNNPIDNTVVGSTAIEHSISNKLLCLNL